MLPLYIFSSNLMWQSVIDSYIKKNNILTTYQKIGEIKKLETLDARSEFLLNYFY